MVIFHSYVNVYQRVLCYASPSQPLNNVLTCWWFDHINTKVNLWCRMETRKCRPNVIVVLLFFPFLLGMYHKLYFLHLICVACPCRSYIHYPRQQIPYCWLFVVCKSSWNHGWLSTGFPDGFWPSPLYFIDWKPNFQPHQISLKSKSQTLFFEKKQNNFDA